MKENYNLDPDVVDNCTCRMLEIWQEIAEEKVKKNNTTNNGKQ